MNYLIIIFLNLCVKRLLYDSMRRILVVSLILEIDNVATLVFECCYFNVALM